MFSHASNEAFRPDWYKESLHFIFTQNVNMMSITVVCSSRRQCHSEAAKAAILRETLLGVEGGFEPVVQMVDAIVSNPFLTGAAYKVDGGRSLA